MRSDWCRYRLRNGVTALEPTALVAVCVQNISVYTVYINIFCTRSASIVVGSRAVTREMNRNESDVFGMNFNPTLLPGCASKRTSKTDVLDFVEKPTLSGTAFPQFPSPLVQIPYRIV